MDGQIDERTGPNQHAPSTSPDLGAKKLLIGPMVKKRFRSGVSIHRSRSFPGGDIGSDHDLVMMTFRVGLKKA